MFIGRKKELASLEKMYRSGRFEFCVIYGRRRVGKTALINHFLSEKKPYTLWESKAMKLRIL